MNIFLFTFILGWYTEFSIFDAKQSFNKRNREDFKNNDGNLKLNLINIKKEANILLKYFGYSILIYLIFILTTKCELEYLIVFLILILASFIVFILKHMVKRKKIKTKLSIFEFISKDKKR